MHFSLIFISLAGLPSLVTSHDESRAGIPKIFGLQGLSGLESLKSQLASISRRAPQPQPQNQPDNNNTEDQCGSAYGSCASGYCCSLEVRSPKSLSSTTYSGSTGMVWKGPRVLFCTRLSTRLRNWMRCSQGSTRSQHRRYLSQSK
jgi:hypothetical protein